MSNLERIARAAERAAELFWQNRDTEFSFRERRLVRDFAAEIARALREEGEDVER